MKLHISITFTILSMLFSASTFAQESSGYDSLAIQVKQMQSVMNTLSKIKISGYVQAQFQAATAMGVKTYEGGNFAEDAGNRFIVRRGRIKVQHSAKISSAVLQIDLTEKGVGIKDAYLTLSEPWTNTLSLTMGLFNRPFGFELPYSSSQRESPERGRMSQIIFPGERDLGLMLKFKPQENSPLRFVEVEAGIFNGNGIAGDFDSSKDFIGRLRLNEVINKEAVKFSVGGSYYNGRWVQDASTHYEIGTDAANLPVFVAVLDENAYHAIPREYIGADAQFAFKWAGGTTTLRGEYIFGTQSGLQNSTTSPSSSTQPTGPSYVREFDGAYFYFVHDILQSGQQLVVKYDWYDPNTKVDGNQIGLIQNNLEAAEIKYESLGFGWNYQITSNLKFMAFYQTVKNENTFLPGFLKDVNDDVVTLRLQHKF